MKKALLLLISVFSITSSSFASNNYDYSYSNALVDTGYVAYVNPERPFVYYRNEASAYDTGVGASAAVKTNNYPDTSTMFNPSFLGVSGAYSYSAVNGDPKDRTIHSYTSTYQHGEGPTQFFTGTNWENKPTYANYMGPFGKSKTGGYFVTSFHVEPGTSGLAEGTPVELNLGYNLEGTVSGNANDPTRVYFGAQVFNISDQENFSFPDADRAERWWSSHNRGELLEMYTGDPWLGMDPALAFDSGNGWGTNLGSGDIEESDDFGLDAKVGDWLLVEGYFESITELPQNGGLATDLQSIADFGNTMRFSFTPGEDFAGIDLVPKAMVPEPISSALFLLGAGAMAVRRFKKK